MAVKSVEPYTGSRPYIFISYAHVDKEQVYPILDEMGRLGYRLWWDEALVATEQWKAVISRHLKQAAIMVLFVSEGSMDSENVRKEINLAENKNITILPIRLEEVEYSDGNDLTLIGIQRIEYYKLTGAVFYKKLSDALPATTKQHDLTEELRIARERIQALEAENKHLSAEHSQLTARIHALEEELNVEKSRFQAERVQLNEQIRALKARPIAPPPPPPKPRLTLTKGQKDFPFAGKNWRVLDVKEGRALLLSENIIERRAYNDSYEATTWAECTLRQYLNGEFYEHFLEGDRGRILQTHNRNPKNPWYDTAGGNDTDDHIFLLSLEELVAYLGDSGTMKKGENNAKMKSKWFFSDKYDEARKAKYNGEWSWWWLRSPGSILTVPRLSSVLALSASMATV